MDYLTRCLLAFLTSVILTSPSTANVNSNQTSSGKLLFLMGQDTTTLREYKKEVLDSDADMPAPAGITLYSSILPTQLDSNHTAPGDATLYLAGIEGKPANEFNGEVNFHESIAAFESVNAQRGSGEVDKIALAVGLYVSDAWVQGEGNCANLPMRAIVGTGDDEVGSPSDPSSLSYQWRYGIDRLLTWFKEQQRPVFFRFAYEYDGAWYCYDKDLTKKAFIYIKDRINALKADNVSLVWQSATYPNNDELKPAYRPFAHQANPNQTIEEYFESWYPVREDGTDDIVDYVAVSYFAGPNYLNYQWSCQDAKRSWTVPEGSPRLLQDVLLNVARKHKKPLMIAESAPQGINVKKMDWSCIASRTDHLPGHQFSNPEAMWNAWFADYFDWIRSNTDTIKVVSYINTNWQSQSRWFCKEKAIGCPEGYWGATSIQDHQYIQERFKQELKQPYYFNAN